MTKHRDQSIAFQRQIAQEFNDGEALRGLAKRHDLSRNLTRVMNIVGIKSSISAIKG